MQQQITDIVADLSAGLKASGGSGARATFGKTQAFAYVGSIMSGLVANVPSAITESSTFPAMKIATTTPVTAWTTGDKPITATMTEANITLVMYPSTIQIPTRAAMDTANLGAAVNRALLSGVVRAFDADVVADLLVEGQDLAKAASLATIAEAQSILLGDGYSPDIVCVSPAVYATLASSAGVVTAGADPQAPIASVLGSRLVVSSALGADEAIVLDSNSVFVVEHSESPVALIDVHARQNSTDVVVELLAGHVVADAGGIVGIATP